MWVSHGDRNVLNKEFDVCEANRRNMFIFKNPTACVTFQGHFIVRSEVSLFKQSLSIL